MNYRLDSGTIAGIEQFVARVRAEHADGGAGSGNWGHLGRKGIRGGSAAKTGGMQNRHKYRPQGQTEKVYTSWSKKRDEVAKPHKVTREELDWVPEGSIFVVNNVPYKKEAGQKHMTAVDGSGKTISRTAICNADNVRIALDKTKNPNRPPLPDEDKELLRRMEDAEWRTPKEADDLTLPSSGAAWNDAGMKAKGAVVSYTGNSYASMNQSMRNGKSSPTANEAKKIINKAEIPEDMMLSRGVGPGTTESMFGITYDDIQNVLNGKLDPNTFAGREGTDKAFMSSGMAKGKGFTHKPFQMNMFVPAGTKGFNAEHVSHLGNDNFGTGWDGSSRGDTYSDENEIILGSGSSVKLIRLYVKDGRLNADCAVTGQTLE